MDEKCQANQRGCRLIVRKDPEDSKCLELNFINLNEKKIYNKPPHLSGCLIQTFRPSGFFSVFTKSKPGLKKYTIWNSYLYTFEVKIRLRNTLKKQDIHNWYKLTMRR